MNAAPAAAGRRILGIVALLGSGCGTVPDLPPLPEGTIAFGVFGDGPYYWWENRPFRRLLEDVNGADVDWLIHIGDILWIPCSDEAYTKRLQSLSSLDMPVIYTPGDNEWADCHTSRAGGWQPLDRLARLRAIFFADPHRSVGGRPMPVATQADDAVHAEFVENARWRRGALIFATVHMVGSGNAGDAFPGRTAADDDEVVRRTAAALAWVGETFAIARAEQLRTVVIALHGSPFGDDVPGPRPGYEELVARLESLVAEFPGDVVLIHGDSHWQRVDRPLTHPGTREPLANFTRLETFGSSDIGWVRVVIDTVAGRIVDYQPRLMPGGLPFH